MNDMTLRWGLGGGGRVHSSSPSHRLAREGAAGQPADYFLDGRRTTGSSRDQPLRDLVQHGEFRPACRSEAYKNGVLYGLYSFGYFLFTPLAMWLLLRFFYDARSFTAYEYLERRYDGRVRTLGALLFLGRGCCRERRCCTLRPRSSKRWWGGARSATI